MPQQLVFRTGLATLLSAGFLGLVLVAQARADDPGAIKPKNQTTNTPTVTLEDMTWVEVRDRLAQGTTTIIIPTGGTEQNGAHMVLGKHNFIVRETATRIARQLGNAIVAPVIGYVPEGPPSAPRGHMAFPGTISLTPATFEAVLSDAATSFKTHGFKTIVLLGDSGGNQPSQEKVAAKLNSEWAGEGVKVIHAGDYYAANGGDDLLKQRGLTASQIGTHAGVRDTSELMAVRPAGVDLTRAIADSQGATGESSLSSRELGEALLAGKVAAAVTQIKNADSRATQDAPAAGVLSYLYSLVFG